MSCYERASAGGHALTGSPRIRVTFVNAIGTTPGGAERTLGTFLASVPPDVEPSAVLFEDGSFADELRGYGVDVHVVNVSERIATATREDKGVRAALDVPSAVLRVARELREIGPSLVYTNSMKAHFIGSIASRLSGIPCVIHFHDLFDGTPLRMLQLVSRVASTERIACSHLVADTFGVGKTTVIYAPVDVASYGALEQRDVARAKLGFTDDLPIVTLVGRINRWKGHDRFVRIAARVNAQMPVRFAIVGAPIFRDADFVPELQALVAELGMTDRVTFHPWVDDVRDVYAASDLNANCSTREPFGRTIVEAAAAGLATVCFADSGASETIVDGVTGRTIGAGDEEAFAQAILDALRDRAGLERMGRAARDAAGRFDSPVIAGEMATVIRRAAKHRI
jgi:glycosyltransferase involved in cell wall biosynthesis